MPVFQMVQKLILQIRQQPSMSQMRFAHGSSWDDSAYT